MTLATRQRRCANPTLILTALSGGLLVAAVAAFVLERVGALVWAVVS